MTSASKYENVSGNKMSDIVTLRYIKDSIKAPFVGGKSKKFPEGLQIGMFSNGCGDAEWQNAEKYHKEKVCCKAGKYVPCDEL